MINLFSTEEMHDQVQEVSNKINDFLNKVIRIPINEGKLDSELFKVGLLDFLSNLLLTNYQDRGEEYTKYEIDEFCNTLKKVCMVKMKI